MKVTYLKLENVAGLVAGSNKEVLEISFDKSINKIISIQAPNSTGKSVLISSISPFAYVSSIDERSSLSYIVPGKNGYKEIHYLHRDDVYVIKHYFKATKDSHSVKSYFSKNGEELNENGNVRSFESLVEIHFGLTQEMMRLVRIGTNVNSFISLTPAKRKEYIGKLIEEIDLFLKVYKKINDDSRVIRTLTQANNTNLYNCHITDPILEKEKLVLLEKDIRVKERERDNIVSSIAKVNSLMKDNDIDDLKRKLREAEIALEELDSLKRRIEDSNLESVSINDLIKKRNTLSDEKLSIQSRINSLRLAIDSVNQNIERLEISVKKVTSNNDLNSLISVIENLKDSLNTTPQFVINFNPNGSTSEDIHELFSRLQSLNHISQMIYNLGNKPIEIYLKLRDDNIVIDKWLKEQSKRSLSRIDEMDLKSLLDQVFKDDMIISPNCNTEYIGCPYYRLSEVINDIRGKINEEVYSDEILRYIQVISKNVDDVLNELDRLERIKVTDKIRDNLNEKSILNRMKNKLPFFDLSDIQEYLSVLREYEIYKNNLDKLKQYEYQLSIYQKAGINQQMEEINHQKELMSSYKKQITELNDKLIEMEKGFMDVDSQIALVTKFNDGKKHKSLMESVVSSTKKTLAPLETAANEKAELEFQLRHLTNAIASMRDQYRVLDSKISEYNRLLEESKKLTKIGRDLEIIMESTSTKKGIPVYYMKRYLKKIKTLSNQLLNIVYGEEFRLGSFNVTADTFEVPYIKNGRKVPDIKYSSQSEIALSTMALSFALSNSATGNYNILLLDEIDAGLDESNRSSFLKMLYMQMETLKAEQVFIISHNLSQMANVPMDCIRLADTGQKLKLQNIIYE